MGVPSEPSKQTDMPRLRPCKHKVTGKMIRGDGVDVPLEKTKIKLKRNGEISGKIKYVEFGSCQIWGRWNRHHVQIHYDLDFGGETGVYNYHWDMRREDGDFFTGEYRSDQGSEGGLEINIEPVDNFSSSDDFSDGGWLYGPSKCKCEGYMIRDDEAEVPLEKTKFKLHSSGRVSGKIVYEEFGKCKITGKWDGDSMELYYALDFGGATGVYNYTWNMAYDDGKFRGEYNSDQGSHGYLRLDVVDVDEFSDSGCSEDFSDDLWDW